MRLFWRKSKQHKDMHPDAIHMHAYLSAASILQVEVRRRTIERMCSGGHFSDNDIREIKAVMKQIEDDLDAKSREYMRGRANLRYIEYPDEMDTRKEGQ